MKTNNEPVQELTKIDVTHRKPTDPGVIWLISNGYRFKNTLRRVFLVRPC